MVKMVFTMLNKAKAELAKAKKTLEADGVKFPIHLDIPVDQTAKSYIARIQSFKQSVEKVLGTENVVIDIQQVTQDELLNVTYYAANAAAEDWDLQVLLDGTQTIKTHQLTLISCKQVTASKQRLTWDMMTHQIQQLPKLV